MIVDASAVLAILIAESDADRFAAAIAGTDTRSMSAINWFKVAIAIDRRGKGGAAAEFAALMHRGAIEILPFDREQAAIAREAYAIWGKGRHRAYLNMGDCAAYALVRSRRESLLFKGADFALTDIEPALKE